MSIRHRVHRENEIFSKAAAGSVARYAPLMQEVKSLREGTHALNLPLGAKGDEQISRFLP